MIASRPRPNARRTWLRPSRIALGIAIAIPAWIAFDILMPRSTDFRQFDAVATGRLDAEMWRSYYERKPAKLFWQLARSLRVQFDAGFWQSFPIAYRAAKAAFTFKDGRSRDDYAKAPSGPRALLRFDQWPEPNAVQSQDCRARRVGMVDHSS
jgi:hypothetical protein